ncbi:hypothetical protein BDV36DRAFT_275465 [Aspergillus pseudocaelatus]|uniref:Uncharacterized protein n=1 Tax=Aspergillus pseudocaelatus TaxID=1825620 RepID=A0ABQ6W262_9EURO|nr:hypothetical protein BDV36DRAFT_275465 [Aspergillus pseudocaelatus]
MVIGGDTIKNSIHIQTSMWPWECAPTFCHEIFFFSNFPFLFPFPFFLATFASCYTVEGNSPP